MDQVLRSFLLALLALTGVIVLILVAAEATRQGLEPADIARLVPFLIPSTLVYTIPVALLFAVTVIYGRLASDNEVIAIKAAGLSAMTVVNPSLILGVVFSALLCVMQGDLIPNATYHFKSALFKNMEDTFYMFLKRERQFDNARWPFFIGVKDVQGRILIGAIFKHRKVGAGNPNTFDFNVQAKKALVHFDTERGVAEITVWNADLQGPGMYSSIPKQVFEYKLPSDGIMDYEPKAQELTSRGITRQMAKLQKLLANERRRQAVSAAFWIGSGRIGRVNWPKMGDAFRDYARWERQMAELQTEKQMRIALASGGFFFVLLGAPVGLLFARRDFLSAFITCFLPIIIIYYPLVLAGVNLGREQVVPSYVVWSGNLVLGLLAGCFALPPVIKH